MLYRRLFALTAMAPVLSAARAATPEASTPVTSFVALSPESVFEMLLAAPFSSPLVPAGAGEIVVSEWIDSSDTDLEGAVGGLLFGGSMEGEEASLGAIIVLNDEVAAAARVDPNAYDTDASATVSALSVGGAEGVSIVYEDGSGEGDSEDNSYATSAIGSGFVVISGGADGIPYDELELRSVSNVVALFDHYLRVVTSIQT